MLYIRALKALTLQSYLNLQVAKLYSHSHFQRRYFRLTSPHSVPLRARFPSPINIQMAPPRGRGGREQSREYRISRELTFILRHAAEKEGIKIDRQGYANVGELVSTLSQTLVDSES